MFFSLLGKIQRTTSLKLDYKKSDLYEEQLEIPLKGTTWPHDCNGMHDILSSVLMETATKVFSIKEEEIGMPCNSPTIHGLTMNAHKLDKDG